MLTEEQKQRRRDASRRWYEKNKDYKNPNPEKVAETARKASLKYYYKNKGEINSKNKKIYNDQVKAKRADRIAQTLKVVEPEILFTDFSVLPKRINLPFKSVWGGKSEGGFFPLA